MDSKSLPKLIAFLLILLIFSVGMNAQERADKRVDELMEVAIAQMNDGNYEEANITFRKILKLGTVLPDDLSYLFAETLYMVGQFHNSRNFVDKYIRLAGPNGYYYAQAMELRHYLDDEYEMILVCKQCDNRGYKLMHCDVCEGIGEIVNPCFNCRGVGISNCDQCKGNGVLTALSSFGATQYQTCTDCDGKGRTHCKVCDGTKTLSDTCPSCHGTNKKAGTELCNHEESALGSRRSVRMLGTFD